MELYQKRWQKARELMAQKGIDALLVTPSTDLAYMTGHTGQSMERIVCFALTQERVFFLMPSFEMDNLSEGLRQSVECIGWKDGEDPLAMLAALPGIKGRIAVGQRMYGIWLLGLQERIPGAQWVNGDVILSTLRRVKDAQELEYMFRAQHMAEAALEKLYAIGLEGKTEREEASLLSELRLAEGVGVSSVGHCGMQRERRRTPPCQRGPGHPQRGFGDDGLRGAVQRLQRRHDPHLCGGESPRRV